MICYAHASDITYIHVSIGDHSAGINDEYSSSSPTKAIRLGKILDPDPYRILEPDP